MIGSPCGPTKQVGYLLIGKCLQKLSKRFHDDKQDDNFTRFVHLQQIETMNEYTHEWEVLATSFPDLINDQLLRLYILGLKPIIHS